MANCRQLTLSGRCGPPARPGLRLVVSAATPSHIESTDPGRRRVLQAALLQLAVQALPSLASCSAQAATTSPSSAGPPAVDAQALATVQAYWSAAVQEIKGQLGDGFNARLLVYGLRGAKAPPGAPGDPAKDYASSGKGGDGHCGPFQPGAESPYALCSTPGEPPADDLARGCCRHYAYCTPYGRLSPDPTSTVVVSPRLLRLPAQRWQAILVHELGHAVDFYLFGGRYGLRSQPSIVKAASGGLRAVLEAAGAEQDVEARGDILGEGLLLLPRGRKLCYDPALQLQLLVDGAAACDGDGSGSQLMRHFSHPVIPDQR